MSENELQMLLNRLESETALSTAEALAVAKAVLSIAQRESVACALADGLAAQLYGYAWQAKAVDFIGERGLRLQVARYLTFGGESYRLLRLSAQGAANQARSQSVLALSLNS
jgi:hypothetical protein